MHITVRPAALADAPAVCTLLNEVDTLEIGRPETDLATVEDDLQDPDADLAHDSWLAYADGRLVAYGLLWDGRLPGHVDADHYVLPAHQAAGLRLLALMEARAAAKAAAAGADRAVVRLSLNVRPTIDTARLAARGWQVVRRHQVMTRPVSPAADPVPVPPPGVTVRACTTEADRRSAHGLLQRAMEADYFHRRTTYEEWRASPANQRLDWSLVWIAALEGDIGDAGVLVGRDDRETMGWIASLGVLADARGRGLGGLLLRHAFAAFAARGREVVGLGVDTRNASGALGIYERVGMRLHYAVDTWEITLPAGQGKEPEH